MPSFVPKDCTREERMTRTVRHCRTFLMQNALCSFVFREKTCESDTLEVDQLMDGVLEKLVLVK